MNHRPRILRIMLIVVFATAATSVPQDLYSPVEATLSALRDALSASPAPWPPPWCIEYTATIRDALTQREEPPDFAARLNALRHGFPSYWQEIRKDSSRTLFEAQCAEIKWYIDCLMGPAFPDEQDKRTLRAQWEGLWRDAADGLLAQFPFLDPNVVLTARADHLRHCVECIEAPLKPIFQQSFTADQIERLREGWHELRYARVDLMRQLGGEEVFLSDRPAGPSTPDHPHYLLVQRSLQQLESYIWSVVADPPDDVIRARQTHWETEQRRRQRILTARAQEKRLESDRFRQFQQTEYLSFLLAVVLESPHHLPAPSADGPATPPPSAEEPLSKEVMPMR